MSSSRVCPICAHDYGGLTVPTLLICCKNHLCYSCAESYRNEEISKLTGNKKKIPCYLCRKQYHSSKETPWIVNNPFIEDSGIDVDLTFVKESQAAMKEAMMTNNQRKRSSRRRPDGGATSNNSASDNLNVKISQDTSRSRDSGQGVDGEENENTTEDEEVITDLSNSDNASYAASTNEAERAVENNDVDVIDLCDDNDGDEKQKDEFTSEASTANDLKRGDEQTVCDEESPKQGEEAQISKPLFEIGDSVFAHWEQNNLWYPGTIQSYTVNDCKSRYGESRTYRINFDDGDVGDNEDYNVFYREDFLLLNKHEESTWKGVKSVRDEGSSDGWAKFVGWYVVTTADGKTLTFSTLLSAMKSYDESVLKQDGNANKSELNLPEDDPILNIQREVGVNASTQVAEAGVERKSKRRKIDDDDQNKTLSAENEIDVNIEGESGNTTSGLHGDQGQALRKSCFITRKRLACLTGGKLGQNRNPLNVGTPVTYVGGPAMATKNGRVHHLCMKEDMNHPYPSTNKEPFVVYRRAPSQLGKQQRDVKLLIMANPNHPPIPIFWEPTDQSGSDELRKLEKVNKDEKTVMYIGHWNIARVEDMVGREEMYLGCYRCAKIHFVFSHFDERWEKIIRRSHDQTIEQIKELDFDDIIM